MMIFRTNLQLTPTAIPAANVTSYNLGYAMYQAQYSRLSDMAKFRYGKVGSFYLRRSCTRSRWEPTLFYTLVILGASSTFR